MVRNRHGLGNGRPFLIAFCVAAFQMVKCELVRTAYLSTDCLGGTLGM